MKIVDALRNAHVIIVCLSQFSVGREGYVQKEIKHALDISQEKSEGTIFIIPFRFDDCDIPTCLQKYHFVNYSSADPYSKLLKSLEFRAKHLLGSPEFLVRDFHPKMPTELTNGVKFFITHSHADNAFAQRFANDLRRSGLDGFFDIYSIRLGDNIPVKISKGLSECDIYMPILSRVALASPWCEEEISAAIMLSTLPNQLGRPRIIPVLIEDCQVRISQQYPLLLTRLYVSFVGRYDEALQELLRGFGLPKSGYQLGTTPDCKVQDCTRATKFQFYKTETELP